MSENAPSIDFRNYAGPVARAFELSTAPVAVIIGPTGGGKSQAAARKALRVALNQHPSPKDGVRKARIVVVAPTYRRAHDTVIPSWLKVWPKDTWGKWSGGKGDPCDHIIDMNFGSAQLHLEVLFRAVQDLSLEEFVRGLETTAWWFPEMDTMQAEDLLSLASNRVGRYPEPDDRPEPTPGQLKAYAGVYGDANAPVIGGWFFKRFYTDRAKHAATDRVFLQPDAFSAKAENMHNLRKINANYYRDLAANMADYDVGRLLRCQPGWSRNGKPVHEHFDTVRHVSTGPVPIDPELELRIGADCGNTLKPAATFSQRSWSGQHRFLREISPVGRQLDLTEFAAEIRRIKDTEFREVKNAVLIVDPSARGKSTTNQGLSYAQILQGLTGIEVRLAPSNDPGLRRTAVDQALKRSAGPGEAGLLCCPHGVPKLIEALAGGYRFKKSGDAYHPQPEKNDHSHEAEAAQYDLLELDGLGSVGGGGLIRPHDRGGDYDDQQILGD